MKTRGFTLVEMLVTMAVIAIVATLTIMAISRVREMGNLTREINGCRQLIAGYIQSAADRNGELLIGYAAKEGARDDRGEEVPNPACGRYPWRIAPYLGFKLRGTVLVNEQEEIATLKDHPNFVYRASANPSFGINATFVGGNERTGIMPTPSTLARYGNFVATRLSQVSQPAKLMVFASARYSGSAGHDVMHDGAQPGFHLLSPPRTTQVHWQGKFDPDARSDKFGYLDLRHNRRAVCAMLGGNIEMLDEVEIQDMRYWSHHAADADDPKYLLTKLR
jgi:prepilin-type N-terminal cleavage/methylation domain-containing protein